MCTSIFLAVSVEDKLHMPLYLVGVPRLIDMCIKMHVHAHVFDILIFWTHGLNIGVHMLSI